MACFSKCRHKYNYFRKGIKNGLKSDKKRKIDERLGFR